MTIKIYGADWCSDCIVAKNFLSSHQIQFDYIDIMDNDIAIKINIKEKALRHIGLSYFRTGNQVEACSTFRKLLNTYPKRMYRQELQKYCGN